jgi:CHRD domain
LQYCLVSAQQQSSQTFTAELTVENEVPPVNTQATGVAQFQLSSDGKEINYDNFLPREYYTV